MRRSGAQPPAGDDAERSDEKKAGALKFSVPASARLPDRPAFFGECQRAFFGVLGFQQ
jgi:hypothetical protein